MRRKRWKKEIDRALLEAIFMSEAEWKQLRFIMDNSVEPILENKQRLLLSEAKYMFLLREAKHRKISVLRY